MAKITKWVQQLIIVVNSKEKTFIVNKKGVKGILTFLGGCTIEYENGNIEKWFGDIIMELYKIGK